MKFCSIKTKECKHGRAALVAKDNKTAAWIEPETSFLKVLEKWKELQPSLKQLNEDLHTGKAKSFAVNPTEYLAPVPFAPGFYDGSAFLSHVVRARKARGDQMPESAKITPLMYQGVSDFLLGPTDPISLMDPGFGGDFEGEYAVLTTEVPRGTKAEDAGRYIACVILFNDITFREIVKTEIETKFGFLQSKPNSAFAPYAVTPDELGSAWDGKRVALDMSVKWNGEFFGNPNGKEMHFTFPQLIAHACRTRPLAAGSIVGTGTVSNEDKSRGFTCLVEKRFEEIIEHGKPQTSWLKVGDRVEMDVTLNGVSVFGKIDQKVTL